MKIVGCLSGGKDSIYNLWECIKNGHEIIGICNLRPPLESITDELDSEMYQTVGWNAIEYIAKCMGLPLYQHYTKGRAIQKSLVYNSDYQIKSNNITTTSKTTSSEITLETNIEDNEKITTMIKDNGLKNESNDTITDEVEDLYTLLSMVKSKHPDLEGVAVGAILSNYQRLRVEAVCERLNLCCVAYLWQRSDQDVLLREMLEMDMDVIMIKCACMGLNPFQHLNKNMRELYEYLCNLGKEYGINVCGEGGEYETLVLDCPYLYRYYRIAITECEITGGKDLTDPINPSGYLKITKMELIPKLPMSEKKFNAFKKEREKMENETNTKEMEIINMEEMPQWLIYRLDDDGYSADNDGMTDSVYEPMFDTENKTQEKSMDIICSQKISTYGNRNSMFQFVCHPFRIDDDRVNGKNDILEKEEKSITLDEEFELLLKRLDIELNRYKLNRSHIFYVQLWLRDMSLFPQINIIYKKQFKGINPPSRVCCQIDLHPKCRVALEALAYKYKKPFTNEEEDNKRKCEVLHVQSISKWAPCCIGPYSQLSKINNMLLFAAGQIGLNPATMSLIKNERKQMLQTIHNMNAGLQVMGSSLRQAIHHNVFVLYQPPSIVSWQYRQRNTESVNITDDVDNESEECDFKGKWKSDVMTLAEEICLAQLNTQNFIKTPNTILMLSVPKLPKDALMELQTIALSKSILKGFSNLCESVIKDSKETSSENISTKNTTIPQNNSGVKKEVKLKYAHLKKKRKKQWRKLDIDNVLLSNDQITDLGNTLTITNRGIFTLNLGDSRFDQITNDQQNEINRHKMVSYTSVCELKTNECDINVLHEILKGAVFSSVLGLNGYGYWFDNARNNWVEQCVVYIRVYYVAEILECAMLQKCIQQCMEEQKYGVQYNTDTNDTTTTTTLPNFSMIPVKSIHLLKKNQNPKQNFGIYCIQALLYTYD